MTITTRPELVGDLGMVASTNWLASAAGMSILERGGNAFDAGVAAGLLLQVVAPQTNGPGGEASIILFSVAEDRVRVVNGQGRAPRRATIEHFSKNLDLSLVPGTGLLSACVPGAFDAWMTVLADYGSLRLRDVLEPAISYAAAGIPVGEQLRRTITRVEPLFREHWRTSAELYLANGVPRVGSRLRNPALAATYRRIVEEAEASTRAREEQIQIARALFYRGPVAEAIDTFVAGHELIDSSGQRHRGLLDADDLAVHTTDLEDSVTYDYCGYRVHKTGPWGQGPVFLQQLALLEDSDLPSLRFNSPEYLHLVIEASKLAFADREAWYGDPAFVDVPLETLLSSDYNAERRRLIGEEASFELRPGIVGGRMPNLPEGSDGHQVPGAGEPTVDSAHDGDTCHVDVVDAAGNLFSATPSGGWLQSSPVIPELGFGLGTRAQAFWLEHGHPNALEPGKRPRTTLTPSLAIRDDGSPSLAFGTPGGDYQDQWSLAFFLGYVHYDLGLQAVVDAPSFHSDHVASSFYPRRARPGSITVEPEMGKATIDELRRRGHEIDVAEPWSLGRITAVSQDSRSGWLRAVADPRGMASYAVGR